MIIVTGTKRSGTSLWMQILQGAGFEVLGSKYPLGWETSIRDANPKGFYESILRRGVYYATNPHPKTGAYISPSAQPRPRREGVRPGPRAQRRRLLEPRDHHRAPLAGVRALHRATV
ncbi:MAG: hypothetical protein IPO67_27155 [Deltaproteobacteria bacterium]|nr:hypothetical protein [Deltaproteobacteria bacterium]